MGKLKTSLNKYYEEISEIAQYLWERGWAERNAGNFSINITEEINFASINLSKEIIVRLKKSYPYLKNNFILISAAGSRMKDITREPHKYILIVTVSATGNEYKYFNLNKEGKITKHNLQPTSEIRTHLAFQNMLKETGSKCNAILHSHPTEIIALTLLKKFSNEKKLNEQLCKIHPEVNTFIPGGIGLVPFMESGDEKIANATVKSAKNHRVVVWEKHGCIVAGEMLTDAFELTDIITKSAKIFFLTK